jgi:hypothetical protein
MADDPTKTAADRAQQRFSWGKPVTVERGSREAVSKKKAHIGAASAKFNIRRL